MKLVLQKWSYGAIILLSISVILGSLYHYLGGFEEIKIYQLGAETKFIAGKYFYTKYDDREPQEHFDRCAALILSESIKGVMTTVDYLPDTLDKQMRMQFIGITLDQQMAEIPEGFEVREYNSDERFVAFLSMNPIVRPPIPTLENMLMESAEREGFNLRDYFIRVRYPDNSVQIEGWVK